MSATPILSAYYRHKQGGFTTRLYRAWQALDAAGYTVFYIAAEPLPVTGKHIRPIILPMRSKASSVWYWPEFCWRAVREMRRLTREHQITQHFIFSFFYAVLSILSSMGLGVRTLTFIRGDDVFDSRKKRFAGLRIAFHRVLEKLGMRYSYRVITTSETMRAIINQRSGGNTKTVCLPNHIVTQPLALPRPDIRHDILRIATVSVVTPRKNIQFMLEALSQVSSTNWEYLVIGGDTSGVGYQAQLQAFIDKAGIADKVSFLGWQSDVASILQTCHLFVFPTLHEGSPNALLEAMGYGLPCLASDIPEIREVLPDRELLFPPNQHAVLINKLNKFLQLPGYATVLRSKTAACQARYRFDWNQHIVDLVAAATVRT
ncbi:Glycosyltransferase involved in cell wall bisynthesis [Thiothrix caldifontis]|uniref:Glycosyltransferase involved in cell wall bisynthesis n=1 Tax=Thiothrix caldifontis TaxID=525918 RepID=A0A1H4B182_9GAMM|nr:glycosyltransferase family 4 protein [Thiothrix caldifontis]SEA41856.1 Glycosyltransferase involved in cell wall bisynthesis [Thiothrix caldifontis]